MATGWAGLTESYAVEITPGLLERGLELEEGLGLELEYNQSPRYALARLLMRFGETERPRALLEELLARAAARGDEGSRAMGLWPLGLLDWFTGHWEQALEHVVAADQLSRQRTHGGGRHWLGRKAVLEADLGLVDAARISAEDTIAMAREFGSELSAIMGAGALGHLELAIGNLEAAGMHLRDLPGRLAAGGINDPTDPIWPDAIETLVALGELEQARSYLESYEANARRLGSPLAMEGVNRCRGLVTAAEGDVAAALAELELAVGEQPTPAWVFERARTLLCLGSMQRQVKQKRAARDALEQALATFEELGARLWAEKARAELRRISGRRRASEEVTETEERVAVLAGRGRSNKEIAAELHMSVHTVGAHLSRVYRKLGIRSRSELASRLAQRDSEATNV